MNEDEKRPDDVEQGTPAEEVQSTPDEVSSSAESAEVANAIEESESAAEGQDAVAETTMATPAALETEAGTSQATVVSAAAAQESIDESPAEATASQASGQHTVLVVGGIILVVVLIIVGLFLPPISLGERLGLTGNGDTSEPTQVAGAEPTEEITVEDGFSLILSDENARVKSDKLSQADFLSGADSEWSDAFSKMPPNSALVSDLFLLEFKDDAPTGSVEIEIPAGAEPYQTLDLFFWTGDQWAFSPSQVDTDRGLLTSLPAPLPQAFALYQSSSSDNPEIGAEVLPTQSLPSIVLPNLSELSIGTLTLGPGGIVLGNLAEVPMGGYAQYLRTTNTGALVDTVSLSSLLDDPTAQATNIQSLADQAVTGSFNGVIVDYQGPSSAQKDAYTEYIRELANALHARDLSLIVTLESPFQTENGLDAGGQDWAAIGQVADAVLAQMPLDPSTYGDDGLADQILTWATRNIDRRKLSMFNSVNAVDAVGDSFREVQQDQALGNYGELVLVDGAEEVEPGQAVEVALSGSAGPLEWDPDSLTYRYTYDQAGQPHSVWLGSEALLGHRNRLADRYHLRGFFVRGLGNIEAAEGYGEAIASYLGLGTSPQPSSAAIVWAVEDEEGGIVASSSGENMSYSWEGSDEPGRYKISADFAQGDSIANLGAVEVLVAEVEEPTPTPEPEEEEPEPEATPATVVDTGPVDPGDADAVANTPANIRSGPGLAYGIIGGLATGERVSLTGRNADSTWIQIKTGGGDEGWVFAVLLTVNSSVNVGSLAVVEVEPPTVASGGDTGAQPASPPVIAPAAGGSFELGGQTHSLGNPALMQQAGMRWVKFQHKWGPGDSPDAVAGRIQQAHANGFKVLLSIPGANAYPSSIDFNGYVEFLRGVAALGPDAIEVWNEENIDFEWPAGQISASSYVSNMLAPAYNAIKSANPNVMVISGAPAPTGYFGGGCSANGCDDNAYMAAVAAAGGGSYMDCIGVHFNAGATSPNATSGHPAGGSHYSWYFWPTLNMYYNAFGGSRQVCFTELGYLSGEDFGGVPPRFSWAGNTTVAQHAQWLAEAASLSANSGKVRMMIIFNVDFSHWGDDPQAGYAMLRPNGSCPSCDLLRQVMGG